MAHSSPVLGARSLASRSSQATSGITRGHALRISRATARSLPGLCSPGALGNALLFTEPAFLLCCRCRLIAAGLEHSSGLDRATSDSPWSCSPLHRARLDGFGFQ